MARFPFGFAQSNELSNFVSATKSAGHRRRRRSGGGGGRSGVVVGWSGAQLLLRVFIVNSSRELSIRIAKALERTRLLTRVFGLQLARIFFVGMSAKSFQYRINERRNILNIVVVVVFTHTRARTQTYICSIFAR